MLTAPGTWPLANSRSDRTSITHGRSRASIRASSSCAVIATRCSAERVGRTDFLHAGIDGFFGNDRMAVAAALAGGNHRDREPLDDRIDRLQALLVDAVLRRFDGSGRDGDFNRVADWFLHRRAPFFEDRIDD